MQVPVLSQGGLPTYAMVQANSSKACRRSFPPRPRCRSVRWPPCGTAQRSSLGGVLLHVLFLIGNACRLAAPQAPVLSRSWVVQYRCYPVEYFVICCDLLSKARLQHTAVKHLALRMLVELDKNLVLPTQERTFTNIRIYMCGGLRNVKT